MTVHCTCSNSVKIDLIFAYCLKRGDNYIVCQITFNRHSCLQILTLQHLYLDLIYTFFIQIISLKAGKMLLGLART